VPTLGKKFWGHGGRSFDATEDVELLLCDSLGICSRRLASSYESRSYSRILDVKGIPITFTYCSSLPGFGTIRWKGKSPIIEDTVRAIATTYGREDKLPKSLRSKEAAADLTGIKASWTKLRKYRLEELEQRLRSSPELDALDSDPEWLKMFSKLKSQRVQSTYGRYKSLSTEIQTLKGN